MNAPDLRITLLDQLAAMVCDMDEVKTIAPAVIPHLVQLAGEVLDRMKMELLDIGELPALLGHALQGGVDLALVDRLHNEIERLAGDQVHLLYPEIEEAA